MSLFTGSKFTGVRVVLLMVMVLAVGLGASAQEGHRILMTREYSLWAELHDYGWGIGFRWGRHLTAVRWRHWEANLSHLKNPKEKRVEPTPRVICGSIFQQPTSYVYGKQMDTWVVRFSHVRTFRLFDRARHAGVESRLVVSGGLSAALLKPVYLNVVLVEQGKCQIVAVRYDPSDSLASEMFLQQDLIYGSAGFGRGLFELEAQAGAHVGVGLWFEWSESSEVIKALEVGVRLEYFVRALPTMVNEALNRAFYPTGYIRVVTGWRE